MLNKPIYKSMTVWGLVLFAGAAPMLDAACQSGALSVDACTAAAVWLEKAGAVLTALGIRRAVV